ncbi:MAG TPA: diguanylate cyclase [Terriglobales bacterium]|nr:diguanylate cyclase [Terriglobales bacterium]
MNQQVQREQGRTLTGVQSDSAAVSLDDIRLRLRRLESQDWWLWGGAVLVMLLLTFGILSLSFPGVLHEENSFYWVQLDLAARGLLGLVVVFSVFVVYQQVLIKRLRVQLAAQLAEMAALETRAEAFEKLAIADPLTELYNRRFATEHLPIEIARAARQGYPLTVLMLDLNGFKSINDQHGHAAGDAALQEFARHLKRGFRSSDLPVRMGGDEFMVVLPECSAENVPKALMHLRDLYIEHLGTKIDITFAAGWAESRDGDTANELLARADRALYADKHTSNAEQQVRAAQAALEQQQKMVTVGHMAGGVAHDFNNLLTVIRGYSELLLDYIPAGDALRDKVEEIDSAAQRAATLTRQLLSFTRKQPPDPDHRVDLNKIVSGMDNMIRSLLSGAHQAAFELANDLDTTRADPSQIEQMIMNLVINARDAMPEGGSITIRTGNAVLDDAFVSENPGSRPGSYVSLAVSDTGVGMSEEVKAHIFEPFFTTKSAGEGTGLGLAIVYGVVKQTGSYIAVDSVPGQGTTFTVYFPRAVAAVSQNAASSAASAVR